MVLLKELSEFIRAARPHLAQGEAKGFSTDTRSLKPGDLFIALRGEHFDGHAFLKKAQEVGAVAAVVDTFDEALDLPQIKVKDTRLALGKLAQFMRRRYAGTVIAITGSSGKTTVKEMLKNILSVRNSVVATEGNFNNQIGVPLTLFRLRNEDFAVIEMGTSEPGEIAYLTQIAEPNVSLVNNVGAAHIGGFGTLEAIALEKGAIYDFPGAEAVINLDEDFAGLFQELAAENPQWFYAYDKTSSLANANVRVSASDVVLGEMDSHFNVIIEDKSYLVELPAPGAHNVRNALAAACCASILGIPAEDIVEGLSHFCGVKGRNQLQKINNGSWIIDDTYNANPSSMKAAIEYLATLSGDTVLVMGEMGELGEYAAEAHQGVAKHAQQYGIAQLYFVGEFGQSVVDGFGKNAKIFNHKSDLVNELIKTLGPQSRILVKGSRSAKMEDVVKALIDSEGKTEC